MTKVAIIGGGAAGMMAAAAIAESSDVEIFLIEKNAILGRKVLISGGGRCNVTTGNQNIKDVLEKYPRGKKFLRNAMYAFSPEMVFNWFENHGTRLKIEKDMRVFPKSNNGKDVVGTFEKILQQDRVKILFRSSAKSIKKMDDEFAVELGNGEITMVDKVILALGGEAYRHTGSEGDGYKLAENLGHNITALAPSLSAFMLEESWIKNLSGVSFENVKLRFVKSSKYEFEGPIIFTHKGMSGPAVFALSSLCAYEKIEKNSPAKIFADFIPQKTYDQVLNELNKLIANEPKKIFSNTIPKFVPKSFAKSLCETLSIPPDKINVEMPKKDINKVVESLKNLCLTCVGRVPGDEFVTAGGVNLKDVNEKTMESKICPGLFFAGEILDIDGFTGGYNLQVAWCTGRLAGKSAIG